MQNQSINFKNLCSSIGFFTLFLLFSGSQLKAESLMHFDKTYNVTKKMKGLSYRNFSRDREIETTKDYKKTNRKLITNFKKEKSTENIEIENIKIINQNSDLPSISLPQPFEGFKNNFVASKQQEKKIDVYISEIIIEGWEDHPEGRKLELAAYDAMRTKPGSIINNQTLK